MSEKYFVEVESEESVSAVHHKADSNKWIFFCHGFGSNKEGSYERRCERAVKEGWNAVRFDFRGNGESDGEFIDQTLSSKIKDLESVIKFFDPENFVTFGMSFGGKVVFHQAIDSKPKAVIGKSPATYNDTMDKFVSVVKEKGSYTHFGEKKIDERFVKDLEKYSFEEVAEELSVPVALFQGRSDTTVHPRWTWKAAQNLNKDVRVEMYENESHKMSEVANERLLDSMFEFLDRVI
ncbi:MAG: alpha/beta hydrolase [Nanohaloarchaea archaeon]|nr:alpha/beta hydrolase [Candidatus Nanohaloarchaea archaeon]